MKTFMQWYWLCWIALGFCVPEFIAIATKQYGNTLSDTVWNWFGVYTGQPVWDWSALHIFLALFMIWLFAHIVFGIWA